jgi:malate dehydrogenase (oxaloacetate-decarboxylating)
MNADPSPSYSTTARIEAPLSASLLGDLSRTIGAVGAAVVGIDLIEATTTGARVDVTFNAVDEAHVASVRDALTQAGYLIRSVSDRTFLAHLGGSIEVVPRMRLRTRDQLSLIYTPGVARVASEIAANPKVAWNLTMKGNTVGVVTNGTAVLGLGHIGPLGALPVMEGKAAIFKTFGGLNAIPLCISETDVDRFVDIVAACANGFGGINLEDISAPTCFEIERRLQERLTIPVFHDDQHGTAVVVLAALMNACAITSRSLTSIRVVVIGVGAAGSAISKILLNAGVTNLVPVDRDGPMHAGMTLAPHHEEIVKRSTAMAYASLEDAVKGADVIVGVSRRGNWDPKIVKTMAQSPIVFALANPDPEVMPEELDPGVLLATGRSDLPNQVNNALCFPGLFKGALEARATRISDEMLVAAAKAIAATVSDAERAIGVIVPSIFDADVHSAVANAVKGAWSA